MADFKTESKKKIAQIEKLITKINSLVDKFDPISHFDERLDYLLLACTAISNAQSFYLDYAIKKPNYNRQEVIDFDYAISGYASRLFVSTDKMLKLYFSRKKGTYLEEIPQEKLVFIDNAKKKMLYIAARWFTERQMQVWDLDREPKKQKLPPREPLLHDVFPCFDRLLAVKMGIKFKDGFAPKRLVVCVPPSSGKTYEANIYTNLMLAHHKIRFNETGIIRMTNTAENAYNYGSQVYKMMIDDQFCDIFPEFAQYKTNGKNNMFMYSSREKYLLKDCAAECSDSMFMFGAEAGINGKRSLLGTIIDDLSNGQDDMDNDEIHKKQADKVMSDVLDRSDDDDCPIILMGTMYNENGVQNAFINMWEKRGLKQHPLYKNVRMTKDGKCAVCLVDIEDQYGHSIAPKLYSDEELQEKKEYFITRGKPYVYNLIYRQISDSRNPKTFADETLMHYDFNNPPKSLQKFTKTMMDLTRKSGNDFFASPFLQYNPDDDCYYLTSAIFEQKSLGLVNDERNDFRDKVCNHIISQNCVEACIENNVSNTTGALLKARCQELGYRNCKFRERFTSSRGKRGSNKASRILNMEETIKNHIKFPDKNTIPVGNVLYQAMEQLNNWDSKSNARENHDDFPDALAMFAEEFIFKERTIGHIDGIPTEKVDLFRGF